MVVFHRWFGFALALAFLLVAFWGGAAWFRNKHPGQGFWNLLAACQVGLIVQAIGGLALLGFGGRRPWLHYAYGAFPVLVVVAAHRFSRRLEGLEWAVFAFAGAVNFGLLLRGFMTGTGG